MGQLQSALWRSGEHPKEVCTANELWHAILLHHYKKSFTCYHLVETGSLSSCTTALRA